LPGFLAGENPPDPLFDFLEKSRRKSGGWYPEHLPDKFPENFLGAAISK
jgi:hypothetical protein